MRFIKPFSILVFFILLGTGCSTLKKTYHKTRNALVNFVSVAKETSLPIFEQAIISTCNSPGISSTAENMLYQNFILKRPWPITRTTRKLFNFCLGPIFFKNVLTKHSRLSNRLIPCTKKTQLPCWVWAGVISV